MLLAAGIEEITTASLGADDVDENAAAAEVAQLLIDGAKTPPSIHLETARTGRVNLFARHHGLFAIDIERVNRLNAIDEAITVATLSPFAKVKPGDMVATIKIIAFAVSKASLEAAQQTCQRSTDLATLKIWPFSPKCAHFILTGFHGEISQGLMEKRNAKALTVTENRLNALGSELVGHQICRHDEAAVGHSIKQFAGQTDLILLLGASATADRADVLPRAVVACGGEIHHFGMPVDPGNLLAIGAIGQTHVVILPGCARSPQLNGFDWVLERLCAGLPISKKDIQEMGVGGLLKEIANRPTPRRNQPREN